MRKRSKYRPRPVIFDTMGYVKEGMTKLTQKTGILLSLNIKNHDAMQRLVRGEATEDQITILIDMGNVTEALCRMGFCQESAEFVKKGEAALKDIGDRGAKLGRYVLKAHEITAMNDLLDVHDEQMTKVTVKNMEDAMDLVQEERRQRKMKTISRKGGER